jgi:hypothetical protein
MTHHRLNAGFFAVYVKNEEEMASLPLFEALSLETGRDVP